MLFKNVLKTLRTKWMQLAAIGVIVVLSSMIYTMMFYGLSGIAEPTTSYLEEYNQEDFAVEMLGGYGRADVGAPRGGPGGSTAGGRSGRTQHDRMGR